MHTFIRLCRSNHIPRDTYYYPRAYDVIHYWLDHHCKFQQY